MSELRIVSRRARIGPICSELPNNGVRGVRTKVELRGVRPQLGELNEVLHRETLRSIKVVDPSIVDNGIPNIPSFLARESEDGRGDAFGA
jgi:hypothetical protein